MNLDFQIDFFSDVKYEDITIEISFKGQLLCQFNKDNGIDNIEVEFFHDMRLSGQNVRLQFTLNEFMNILNEARQDLINS
ncbi:hypothetical protein PT286_03460 [Neisseriaceae bacterium ESL0693]|nr:hypothetical protein [Neisseriaceae bacterium ESL0693]